MKEKFILNRSNIAFWPNFFTFLCLLGWSHLAHADHIVGGDMIYKCTNSNPAALTTEFEVTMTVYRDSRGGGAVLDNPALVGVFAYVNGSWQLYASFQLMPTNISNVQPDNNCVLIPPNVGVEKGVYSTKVNLKWGVEKYMVAYQRCCRNQTISNISDPGGTGAVFFVEISKDAVENCDNSPVFKKFPPIVICANEPLNFDHSASDAENDNIVYSFCAPGVSGGRKGETDPSLASACDGIRPSPEMCSPENFTTVIFNSPYSVSSPLGGSPLVTIDPQTGVISGVPNVIGQFVVGVCAQEYRNGVLIGTIRRDFQFNVTKCTQLVVADMEIDKTKPTDGYFEFTKNNDFFEFKSCGSKEINLKNLSEIESYIQNYEWKVNLGTADTTVTKRNASFTFPDYGTYTGSLILNKGIAGCADTAYLSFNIYPKVNGDFSFDYDTCSPTPVKFFDQSTGIAAIDSWEWDFDKLDTLTSQNPVFQFEEAGNKLINLVVGDVNNCYDTLSKTIPWFPVPGLIIVEPSQFVGCTPATIHLQNLSEPINEDYNIVWRISNGDSIKGISPSYTFTQPGFYSIDLNIKSPVGCETSKKFEKFIEVKASPTAGFTYTPDAPNVYDKTVSFVDTSLGAVRYFWEFDEGQISNLKDVVYTFQDTGLYEVLHVVTAENGCTDTIKAIIDVNPLVRLQIPNAFTPNNDDLNDNFLGKGNYEGVINYSMTIFNRWGEKIFETNNPSEGWNGTKNNTGDPAPQGVYIYNISYSNKRNEQFNVKSHVTLIR